VPSKRSSYGYGNLGGSGSFWDSTAFMVVIGVLSLALLSYGVVSASASFMETRRTPSTFTYQSYLNRDGAAVNETCDFQFALYRAEFAGDKIGKTLERKLPVQNGAFSALLDFGKESMSVQRPYLDLLVRCPAGQGGFVQLLRKNVNDKTPYDFMGMMQLVQSVFAEASTTTQPEIVPQYDAVETDTMGIKAQDDIAGHSGAKREAAMYVPEPGTYAPGVKRSLGNKGVRGQQFSVSQVPVVVTDSTADSQSADALPTVASGSVAAHGGQQKLAPPGGKHNKR